MLRASIPRVTPTARAKKSIIVGQMKRQSKAETTYNDGRRKFAHELPSSSFHSWSVRTTPLDLTQTKAAVDRDNAPFEKTILQYRL